MVAVRAPHGTTLEVPDPDEGMEYPKKRYQIFLKSTSGPVEVFLVSLHEKLDEQSEKAAEPSCISPSRKITSHLGAKSDALVGHFADASSDRRPAPASASNGAYASAAATRAVKPQLKPGPPGVTTTSPDPEGVPAGVYPPGSAGDTNANSPAIMRIMPPSCDPDYWFSDEVKEYGIGLNDMFAPAGVDGDAFLY